MKSSNVVIKAAGKITSSLQLSLNSCWNIKNYSVCSSVEILDQTLLQTTLKEWRFKNIGNEYFIVHKK